jgi:hypothetical protein
VLCSLVVDLKIDEIVDAPNWSSAYLRSACSPDGTRAASSKRVD